MKETWSEHNNEIIAKFIEYLNSIQDISIAEIFKYWKINCSASSFSIYIEIDKMNYCFAKISKKKITFGKMNSIIPFNIMNKIRSWFPKDVTMNSRITKASFNVYSDAQSKMPLFIESISNGIRYTIEDDYSERSNLIIRLKEIDH